MKMLMVVYSGADPHRISQLLDRHDAGGYMEFDNVHGAGRTGRREGSRAWPGASTLFLSVMPEDESSAIVNTLRDETAHLAAGERLHVAVLPAETFF